MKPTTLKDGTPRRLRGLARAACAAVLILATASAAVPVGATVSPAEGRVVAAIPGDTDVPVYLVNDSISQVNPFTMKDIGLIDIVQPDSALVHYGTRDVIKVYTREFVSQHPARFPGVPVIAPDTISRVDTAAGGGH